MGSGISNNKHAGSRENGKVLEISDESKDRVGLKGLKNTISTKKKNGSSIRSIPTEDLESQEILLLKRDHELYKLRKQNELEESKSNLKKRQMEYNRLRNEIAALKNSSE